MPPSAATATPSSSSTSVFARLTGRRQHSQTVANPTGLRPHDERSPPSTGNSESTVTGTDTGAGMGKSTSTSTGTGNDIDRGRSVRVQNQHHRRESSGILSLTSHSVNDLSANLRRSVSLRSHRTNPSNGGSSVHRERNLSSGSINHPFGPISGSPIESPEEQQQQQQNTPQIPSAAPPRSRSRLAKTLTHKFRSTDALPKLTTQYAPFNPAVTKSPPKSNDRPNSPFTSMLAGQSAPPAPSRLPPDRPHFHTQNSFSRENISLGGNGAPLHHTTSASTVSGSGQNPYSIYQQIHDTSVKRIATIEYLRRAHEGDLYYFSTLHFTSTSLSSLPSLYSHKLGRRATNYWILGYSLPALLDLNSNNPLEYLKALSALLQEFETYQSLSGLDASGSSLSRGRVGQMFKSGGFGLGSRSSKGRRSSAATDTMSIDSGYSSIYGGGGSGSSSGGNGITGAYNNNNSSSFLPSLGESGSVSAGGPGSGTSGGGGGNGILGSPHAAELLPSPINPTGHEFAHLLTPHLPFEPDFGTTFATLCDTLADAYAKLLDLVSGPDACGPGVGEAFVKADKSIRKILVSNVVREFEDATRVGAKGEIAGVGKLVLGGFM